jgi:hypothetical protein
MRAGQDARTEDTASLPGSRLDRLDKLQDVLDGSKDSLLEGSVAAADVDV